jgi:hypothetical protein
MELIGVIERLLLSRDIERHRFVLLQYRLLGLIDRLKRPVRDDLLQGKCMLKVADREG